MTVFGWHTKNAMVAQITARTGSIPRRMIITASMPKAEAIRRPESMPTATSPPPCQAL